MKFMKNYFMKRLSLIILLLGISNIAQSQPNLLFSLKDFFKKVNSTFYPKKSLNNQNYLQNNGDEPSIGVSRHPFIITPKTFELENVKVQSTNPSIAYDPDNQRYLVVWENRNENGSSSILGQFRDKEGNSIAYPVLISSPRPTRGCFYENFDSDNGAITTPKNCPNASTPAVAYNKGPDGKGRFLVVWELKGTADFAKNSDGSDNLEGKKFSNIIAKMLNVSDLTAASHPNDKQGTPLVWEEGIVISLSGMSIVSNDPTHPASNDSEVQSWEQAGKPDVASSGSNGFLVTWQTNKGFIGCDDSSRRDSTSIYARYIHPEFSPTNRTLNKPMFPVYTDPTAAMKTTDASPCLVLRNVFRAQKPRITYNDINKQTGTSDFVIAYEFVRAASASRGDIGAQKVSLNSSNDGTVVNPTLSEYVVKAGDGVFLENPDVISYLDHVVLAYDDHYNISLKTLTLDLKEMASTNLSLGGNEGGVEPRLSGGLGVSGNTTSGASNAIALSFVSQNNYSAIVLDGSLNLTKGPIHVSNMTQNNHLGRLATDFSNFIVTWAGTTNGIETVKAYKILSAGKNNSPFTPELGDSPANDVTWAPTRLYLSWTSAADPDGDKLGYEVYFSEVSSDPKVFPQTQLYKSDVKDVKFIIQSSTDGRPEFVPNMGISPIYLQANKTYAWKICSKDSQGAISICSDPRRLNTDDSVVGWWRFDSDPNVLCPPGLGKSTAPAGMPGHGVCDYSGNGNHGIIRGGISWLPPMAGPLGGALQFNGTDSAVEITDSPNLNPTNQMSISVYVTPIDGEKVITKLNRILPYSGYDLIFSPGQFIFEICASTPSCAVIQSTSALKKDNKVIGVYDGSNIKIFLNGNIVERLLSGVSLGSNTNSFWIGGFYTRFYHGSIQDTIIYNKALRADEMNNDYLSNGF